MWEVNTRQLYNVTVMVHLGVFLRRDRFVGLAPVGVLGVYKRELWGCISLRSGVSAKCSGGAGYSYRIFQTIQLKVRCSQGVVALENMEEWV
jgi:hypothetical protein